MFGAHSLHFYLHLSESDAIHAFCDEQRRNLESAKRMTQAAREALAWAGIADVPKNLDATLGADEFDDLVKTLHRPTRIIPQLAQAYLDMGPKKKP